MTTQRFLNHPWCLLYSPAEPVCSLIPGQTAQQAVTLTNQCLTTKGRQVSNWSWGDQNQAAKLVRINWIYQRLDREPIRKPILIDQYRKVLCGDTRLASLSLSSEPASVSVLVSVPCEQTNVFSSWIPVTCEKELIDLCNFQSTAKVSYTVTDQGISWLEIGDSTTAHHLHDQDLRVRMLDRYLQTKTRDFIFDLDWCRSKIDWQLFS